MEKIESILNEIREDIEARYPDALEEKCVEACDMILAAFKKHKIEGAKIIEGWCIYDDASSCSDRDFDEHTWVEFEGKVLDVTMDQFQYAMNDNLPRIYMGPLPRFYVYDKPSEYYE